MTKGEELRILLLGATGTIGSATARALVARGHHVICPARSEIDVEGVDAREADISKTGALHGALEPNEKIDVAISCLASRTGTADDARAIDLEANLAALDVALGHGAGHFIYLSAICVQKPRLAFQYAKLEFEAALRAAPITSTIVRPTAFFKSLSGQIERVRDGKPFLIFGDGELTRCKPISDRDLATYIADCIDREDRHGKVLPIGGPGPAISPREQGMRLFSLTRQQPRFRQMPLWLMDAIVGALGGMARIFPPLRGKAEYARIGRYYATESMLVWDKKADRYDADATPEFGSETLFDHYAQRVARSA